MVKKNLTNGPTRQQVSKNLHNTFELQATNDTNTNTQKNMEAKTATNGNTANDMIKGLMSGQLEALARMIAEQNNLEVDAVMGLTKQHCDSMDLTQVSKKISKKTRTSKPRAPPTAEERCMARVWGDGSGHSQCKSRKCEGSDYCKRCAKKAAICCNPCTLSVDDAVTSNYSSWKTTDGGRVKKLGLYCGRIDQPIPSVDANGVLRIIWKNEDVKTEVAEKLESGEWTKPTLTKRKKKAKATKVPTALSESETADLNDLLANDDEDENSIDEPVSPGTVKSAFQQQPETVEDDAVTSDHEDAISDHVSIEIREHDGETYNVTPSDEIVADNGEVVGKWQHRRSSVPQMFAAETKTPVKGVNEHQMEVTIDDFNGLSDNEEEDDDEEALECRVLNADGEEVDEDYDGETYNVGPDNTIYSDEGEEIGMWTKKGPKLFQ